MLTFILHETILVQDKSSQFEFAINEMHVVKWEEVQLDVDSHLNLWTAIQTTPSDTHLKPGTFHRREKEEHEQGCRPISIHL